MGGSCRLMACRIREVMTRRTITLGTFGDVTSDFANEKAVSSLNLYEYHLQNGQIECFWIEHTSFQAQKALGR